MIDYLGMLSKHELDQRMHGLSGVGIVLGDLWVVLKLRMESSASETIKISGAFTLLEPLFFLW